MKPAKIEADIEKYLAKRVREQGGVCRKVVWVNRRFAPDRRVAMPGLQCWVEVKAPGGLATFPKNPHEQGQDREHWRMRKCGERVVILDSYEGVDDLMGSAWK